MKKHISSADIKCFGAAYQNSRKGGNCDALQLEAAWRRASGSVGFNCEANNAPAYEFDTLGVIRGRVINESTNFPDPFSEFSRPVLGGRGEFVAASSRNWVDRIKPYLGRTSPHRKCFPLYSRFSICFSVSKPERFKGDCERKSKQNEISHLLTPAKLREGPVFRTQPLIHF